MKRFWCVAAAVMVALCAGTAVAAVPNATSAVDSTTYEGQTYTFRWVNTADNGTSGKATLSSAINWGDGVVETLATPTDTVKTHVYGGPGSYVARVTAVNADGTGYGKSNITVRSLRVYPFGAKGRIALSANVKSRENRITLNSTAAFRVATMSSGIWEWIDWPVAANVPWTIPASFDSLRIRAMTDTVWVHVW